MRYVNQPIRKKDAMALVTGKPVYTDDLRDPNALVVKVLHSPHANAMIENIDTSVAMKVPGIEAIFTYKDVPQKRFTMAGQTYPEPSPYDRLLLDRHVRFHGDAVAVVAGETEKAVDRALKLIKVTYQVLPAVLDFRTAKDNPVLVHPEDNWIAHCPVGADNQRNLCAHEETGHGDIEAVLADCDVVLERTYHTKADSQAMMETFRTYTYMDTYGRLNVLSSTQIVFHARRIIAHALDIPKSKVRVTKPRIGGGFGAKQSCVTEVFPALVTWKTGKPAYLVYSRQESQTAGSPRHEMEITVRIGAMKDGRIRGFEDYCQANGLAHEVILRELDRSYEEDQAILKDVLKEWDKKYAHQKIGVFLANDTTANTLLNLIIRRYGYLPKEYCIIGFDNSPTSREAIIPLSTVGQQVDQLAHEAVQLLVDQIKARKQGKMPGQSVPVHKIVPPVLFRRATAGGVDVI